MLTIGIAFKNPGSFFKQALASVFAQTFLDWEMLLIDDGSIDDSLSLARSISDARVKVTSDGASKGLAVRLNEMINAAKRPWFVRMDADDVMHPDRLRTLAEELPKHGGGAVLGSWAYAIDASSHIIGLKAQPDPCGVGFDAARSFMHPTVAAATSWFRNHPYSEDPTYRRCEDAELWSRCAAETSYRVLHLPLLYYRESGVFSLENYLGTQRGMIALARTRSSSKGGPMKHVASLSGKMLCARFLSLLGAQEWLVRRRSVPIGEKEMEQARADLDRALAGTLPLA